MGTSVYVFIMSLIIFNITTIVLFVLRKNHKIILNISIFPFLFLVFAGMGRLIINIEPPFVFIVRSKFVFAKVFELLNIDLIPGFSILKILMLIWIIGMFIRLFFILLNYIKFKKTLQKLHYIDAEYENRLLKDILLTLDVKSTVEVVKVKEKLSPMIVGLIHSKIYIPPIPYTKKELEIILKHEVNHLKNKDMLKKMIMQILSIVFWWNPFIYVYTQDFDNLLELQCDITTVSKLSKEEKHIYLKAILKTQKEILFNMKTNKIINALILNKKNNFTKQRFLIIDSYRPMGKSKKRMMFCINLFILVSYIASYFVVIQPVYYPSNEEIYTKDEGFRSKEKILYVK